MIINSAILKDNVIYVGVRHSDIINSHPKKFFTDCIQGFISDSGDFLDRELALEYAYQCNQITEKVYKERIESTKELFSEDLW